jgi:hypothetical protein
MADSETLKLLRSIDGRLGSVETRLGGIETHVGGIETRLRLLGHQMATLIERVTGLEASNTRAIAALNDIARESVTPGEVEALHSEMNELRNAKFNHEVRISATRGRTEYRAFDSTSAAVTLNRAARSPSSR